MYAPLPARYAYLAGVDGPRILVEMLALHGLEEQAGTGDNPVILALADEIGIDDYHHDAIPWCGLALAAAVRRAGYALPPEPLRALSWAAWGEAAVEPALGDVIVFRRPGGGHVGIYVGEDSESYHVLGGNQGDAVSIARFGRAAWKDGAAFGVVAVRRSPWRIAQPAAVRPVVLGVDGPIGVKVV